MTQQGNEPTVAVSVQVNYDAMTAAELRKYIEEDEVAYKRRRKKLLTLALIKEEDEKK